jgi:peroxiredoxin
LIRVGSKVPEVEVRTDEDTPLSLCDLKGRAFAAFLVGEMTPESEMILSSLSEATPRFLALDVSPVAVVAAPVNRLEEFRARLDVPYLMLSDSGFSLHDRLRGRDGKGLGVWIVDEKGFVVETVPALPPAEIVSHALAKAGSACSRVCEKGDFKE